MSRLKVLAARPRMALGALVTLLLATGAVVGSGANFTASSANPSNTFATGTLSMVNSKDNAAVLTAANLRPGGNATGDVDILNSGSLSGTFTLARGPVVDSDSANPLSGKLNLTVDDCGVFSGSTPPSCTDGDEVTKYSGTIADMGTAGHAVASLGSFAASVKHRYHFSVTLDSAASDAYQGATSSVRFDWSAS
jgi:spore coat-associated protein N